MILTDQSILDAMAIGDIDITPFYRKRLGTNSYDVTLGGVLGIYTSPILDPKKENTFHTFKFEKHIITPNRLYLGVTNEFTSCKRYIPMIEGCSSVGRLGISIHVTAGFGDAGFSGHWTLEISCVEPVFLYAGMVIGQVYFVEPSGEFLMTYDKKPNANYNMQPKIPMPSKLWKKL